MQCPLSNKSLLVRLRENHISKSPMLAEMFSDLLLEEKPVSNPEPSRFAFGGAISRREEAFQNYCQNSQR